MNKSNWTCIGVCVHPQPQGPMSNAVIVLLPPSPSHQLECSFGVGAARNSQEETAQAERMQAMEKDPLLGFFFRWLNGRSSSSSSNEGQK